MNVKTNVARFGPRSVAVAFAVLAAAVALLVWVGRAGGAQATAATAPTLSPRAVALRAAMDKLWEEHIVWTRMVIVDFAAGLPDLETAEARLFATRPTSATR